MRHDFLKYCLKLSSNHQAQPKYNLTNPDLNLIKKILKLKVWHKFKLKGQEENVLKF